MTTNAETATNTAASASNDMRLGLALSGGGFRASLFHVGVLARLAELDLLRRVEVLSCVSGGSIIGALYYLYLKRELEKRDDALRRDDYVALVDEMESHFLTTIQGNFRWLTFASLRHNLRMARDDYSRTDRFGELLDALLYRPIWNGKADSQIEMRKLEIHPGGRRGFHPQHDNAGRHNKVPILVINATTLNSGHAWWFQASRMGEPDLKGAHDRIDKNLKLTSERYEKLTARQRVMPLGQAVAASAAVPGILPPFPISDLYEDPTGSGSSHLRVQLVDGGVHDNLGIAALECNDCSHFVVSDATGQMADLAEPDTWPGAVIGRSSSILMDRVRETELDLLLRGRSGRVALMHLTRDLPAMVARPLNGAPPNPNPTTRHALTDHGVHPNVQRLLAELRTDLDAFTDVEACALMADGYRMTVKEFDGLPTEVWRLKPSGAPDWQWRFGALSKPLEEAPPALLRHLRAARHRLFKLVKLDPAVRRRAALATSMIVVGLATMLVWWYLSLESEDTGAVERDRQAEFMFWLLVLLLFYPAYLLGRHLARISRVLRPLGVVAGWAASIGTLAAAPLLWLVARTHLSLFNQRFVDAGTLERIGLAPMSAARAAPWQDPPPKPRPDRNGVSGSDDPAFEALRQGATGRALQEEPVSADWRHSDHGDGRERK